MVKYELKKIIPGIYAVKIKDPYQRAMLFLRSQEFYESTFPEIRGKHFDFFEFMDIYRKWRKVDYFSYPEEWVGFNVPGHIVESCTNHVLKASNGLCPTPYDFIMQDIIKSIRKEVKGSRYYIIGVNRFKSKLMDHELSHGLYYVDSTYQSSCLELISRHLPFKVYKKLEKIILKMGYGKEVVDDEIQAYLSTGLYPSMKEIEGIKKIAKIFKTNFEKYKLKHGL
jgi:hypothetical protein